MLKVIKSPILSTVPAIQHGFGTLVEPIPESLKPAWVADRPEWKQVHGFNLAEVKGPRQPCGEVDGLYTEKIGIPIGIITGDCVPVLLAHKEGKRVAAVHAGWRGTLSGILLKLWDQLRKLGEQPHEWVAAVGPAIGPCCYQVSEDIAEQFAREFEHLGKEIAVPRTRILDLPAIQAGELRRMGISRVEVLRYCTRCSESPKFHSYRRDGGVERQWSIIMKCSSSQSLEVF